MLTSRQIAAAARKTSNQLAKMGTFHNTIPLDEMFSMLQANGLQPVQEDQTAWSGLFCGAEGCARIQLADASVTGLAGQETVYPKEVKHLLVLSWYKMPSGRFEVCSYVS